MSRRDTSLRRVASCGDRDKEDSLSSEVDGPPSNGVDFSASGAVELLDQVEDNPLDGSLSKVPSSATLAKSHCGLFIPWHL